MIENGFDFIVGVFCGIEIVIAFLMIGVRLSGTSGITISKPKRKRIAGLHEHLGHARMSDDFDELDIWGIDDE